MAGVKGTKYVPTNMIRTKVDNFFFFWRIQKSSLSQVNTLNITRINPRTETKRALTNSLSWTISYAV